MRFAENGGEPYCPWCGHKEVYSIATRRKWRCKSKSCCRDFSATSQTVFASRKLSFHNLLLLIACQSRVAKNLNAIDMSCELEVQYKTAFVWCHKVREAMTPTASRLKARLDERRRWFANEWFCRWHFIGKDGPVTIDSFDGRGIHQGGVEFGGDVRELYWETLVRGVKKEITEQLAWVDREVRQYNSEAVLRAIDECAGQLMSFVRVIRRLAVAKDRLLRGNGQSFPPENDAGRWGGHFG